MRLEHFPILLGLLFVLAGVALIADALLREQPLQGADRRKRKRPPRHPRGQAAIGVGTLFVAAALFGRDVWRYGTLAVMLGVVAFGVGVYLNWGYVKAFMLGPEPGVRRDLENMDEPDSQPLRPRARMHVDREVPTPTVPGDLVAGVSPEIEPEPPRTSVPPGETRRLRIR